MKPHAMFVFFKKLNVVGKNSARSLNLVQLHEILPFPFVVPCLAYDDVIRYTRFVLCLPRWSPQSRMSGVHCAMLPRPGIRGKRKARNELYLQDLSAIRRNGAGKG